MLINLIVVNVSRCKYISNRHDVLFKYRQFCQLCLNKAGGNTGVKESEATEAEQRGVSGAARKGSRSDSGAQRPLNAILRSLIFSPESIGIQGLICLFVLSLRGISNMNRTELQEGAFGTTSRRDWVGSNLEKGPFSALAQEQVRGNEGCEEGIGNKSRRKNVGDIYKQKIGRPWM